MADEDAETPVLDVIATLTEVGVTASDLDPALQILVRFAALVALDAAPASYLFHFGAGADEGLTFEDARQVLVDACSPSWHRTHRVGELQDRSSTWFRRPRGN